MQLTLRIDKSATASLQTQVVSEISTSITSGRLPAGTRLPGSRTLSSQLGVSRNTVLLVFSALEAEGFVEAREGSGTFVSDTTPETTHFEELAPAPDKNPTPNATGSPVFCDFQLEAVDPDLFPASTWRRLMMRRMQTSDFNLTKVGDPRGSIDLRQALCKFLGASRGMIVGPEQILIGFSIQQATNVVGQMFVKPGSLGVVERPGCSLIAPIYARIGAEILPVATDRDSLRVELLPDRRNALVAVTPERQFPMGATMSTERRQALLNWAKAHDAHIFEVDFDSDFRYEGSPKPALQTLDHHDRFIYAASFALTIGPGLRIGFLVMPSSLIDKGLEALRSLDHAYPCQALARTVGIEINTLSFETITGPEFLENWDRYLLLGYGDLQPEVIREAVVRLRSVLGQLSCRGIKVEQRGHNFGNGSLKRWFQRKLNRITHRPRSTFYKLQRSAIRCQFSTAGMNHGLPV